MMLPGKEPLGWGGLEEPTAAGIRFTAAVCLPGGYFLVPMVTSRVGADLCYSAEWSYVWGHEREKVWTWGTNTSHVNNSLNVTLRPCWSKCPGKMFVFLPDPYPPRPMPTLNSPSVSEKAILPGHIPTWRLLSHGELWGGEGILASQRHPCSKQQSKGQDFSIPTWSCSADLVPCWLLNQVQVQPTTVVSTLGAPEAPPRGFAS